ncbi:MAG TPA: TonB-dependent receptor plug domain-containing protein [Rhizomicrobium sp.]|nr:TonB-dependent receptor plug domain-containing protein [Rhizomicrobium sp.]
MAKLPNLKSILLGSVMLAGFAPAALAADFNIPGGDLERALDIYTRQSGVQLMYSDSAVKGVRTAGAEGQLSADEALSHILKNTGLMMQRRSTGAITIVRNMPAAPLRQETSQIVPLRMVASASAASAGIESVVVTSSKIKGDIQTVPIAITALSQEQLTSRQIAGGPDLVKEVPNLTFSKTNFTGYNIQIRGIGTQAISVTTDPAVAVAFNDIPFIRNHFFEQEFYDVNQVEVLRGPQGTLYGRNATAGVVNVISAKPTDQFEAMASADIGNYHNRRFEGMINIPIVDDRADLRIAGEWTMRDGYSFNSLTNQPIDGRDLWSTRVTLGLKPTANLQATLVWEHFQESDDRLRSGKQLCKTSEPPSTVNGIAVPPPGLDIYLGATANLGVSTFNADYLSQGCAATSLYSPSAFEVPYGYSLPYAVALGVADGATANTDPYAGTTQSRNLRVIESALNPHYQAKNDTLELNVDYTVTPALTFTAQTGYNQDFLWSAEDFNRFNTSPGIFSYAPPCASGNTVGECYNLPIYFHPDPAAGTNGIPSDAGIFCDPQLGCSDRLVAEDLSNEHAWQLTQEFRIASNFQGPLNFSIGGNYLHYETEENYYVFINALTDFSARGFGGDHSGVGQSDPPGSNSNCLQENFKFGSYQNPNPALGGGPPTGSCVYIDVNPISSLNNEGHNYFLSQNPYGLNSYAGFGEVYYTVTSELKLTGGLRWTEDKKRFFDIPSEVIAQGYGYAVTGIIDQEWNELTGRAAVNWMPKLDFTDQTLVYGSFAHGYKAGGANPPGAVFGAYGPGQIGLPIHPATFRPEFINAYELGTKNSLLDGGITLNGDIFYYDYKAYQISEIVDRTSINLNFNATVKGGELEAQWEPVSGLKFAFAGGYEDAKIANGQSAIDLMDRTAGKPGWMVVKPFPTQASNCILPDYVIANILLLQQSGQFSASAGSFACGVAYDDHLDPVTLAPYQTPTPTVGQYPPNLCPTQGCFPYSIPSGYPGFDPTQPQINNGEGFAKNLGGNQLPNAPHFTTSLSAEYTLPVSEDWAATLHSDFYWQSQSFARVFNDRPYDKIRGYSNVNLALILTGASGWQVMGYLKNVFNTTAITGDFLNSDDSGLTTNVFLTDPRLYGVRITKNF